MRELPKEANLRVDIRRNLNLAKFQKTSIDFGRRGEQLFVVDQTNTIEEGALEYTHFATFHGIPCYFNVETEGFTGRGKFNCLLLDILIIVGRYIPGIGAPSKIVIGAELESDNLYH